MDTISNSSLEKIQKWYHSNCDQEWEHICGISLETVDNPGWKITVDLDETIHVAFKFLEFEYGDQSCGDWVVIRKIDTKLIGTCGPLNLATMLSVIAEWLDDLTHEVYC